MRGARMLACIALVSACATGQGSFDGMFQPVRVEEGAAKAVVPADTDAPAEGTDGDSEFQLDGYKDEQEQFDEKVVDTDDVDAVVAELGAAQADPPGQAAPPPQTQPPTEVPSQVTMPMAAAPQNPGWTPSNAVTLSWGLRLVSTVSGASPPRAILGMPDGKEVVVKAGDLLPDVGVVVLAVGNDVVQLGRIRPQGDHAQVDSVFLTPMYGVPGERSR